MTEPASVDHISVHRSTIGCVISAHDEQDSIAHVIESLLSQTRVPDVIHVLVDDTSDATVEIASQYAGPHELVTELGDQFTEVFVHDIGRNLDEKVGALDYGYTLVEGYDYLLTKISPLARSDAGGMTSVRARRREHFRLLVNPLVRVVFVALLAGSLPMLVTLIRRRHGSKV